MHDVATGGPESRVWDCIVVGTGIGGATLAYALAKTGKTVLICEKGPSLRESRDLLTGDWAEQYHHGDRSGQTLLDYMRRSGRWTRPLKNAAAPDDPAFVPLLGEMSGGSSALYGMVFERFFREDFEPSSYAGEVAGTTAPARWPIGYEDLQSYYVQAEELFRVRATRDLLREPGEERGILEPPAFSAPNEELFRFFQSKGLHPYHVPMACEYVPGCRECIGFICAKNCKGDSSRICLDPAIDQFGAVFLDNCEVVRVNADEARVTSLECLHRGRKIRLQARTIVLAAGALQTPELLLRSTSELWPDGLANRSGQVGRNLMRHMLDYYIVESKAKPKTGDLVKQLAFNDFYRINGRKVGTVQSNGRLPPSRLVAQGYLGDLFAKLPILQHISALLRPFVEFHIDRLLRKGVVLATILEDLPYRDNSVSLDSSGALRIQYKVGDDEKSRLKLFREAMARLLKPYRFRAIYSAERYRMLGHACGTCRFGHDPATSVLDANNKAHGLDNLYVVDLSFLPTSSGTNPSLTVAANALRVADHIIDCPAYGRSDALNAALAIETTRRTDVV